MNDLKQIMLCVLENHEDALILEHNLTELNDIVMMKLTAETHLADSTLRDTRVADLLALLVRLKFLDGEFADRLSIATDSLVHPSISPGADETNDAITICDADLGLVPGRSVVRFYMAFLVSVGWETETDVRAERHRRVLRCQSKMRFNHLALARC